MNQYIDTGVYIDTIRLSKDNKPIMQYACVTHIDRRFTAHIVDDMNAITCQAIRKHLMEQGYTDVLLLDDEFIREAIANALAERRQNAEPTD